MAIGNVMYMDDTEVATDAMFHAPSQNMRAYLGNAVNNYIQTVKSTAPEFANSIRQVYEDISSSAAMRYLANVKNRMNSTWQTNSIRYLSSINDIQQAPDVMRRWIMAEPTVRDLYVHGAISGYEKKFEDLYSGIGHRHYDYRRATEGIVHENEDGTVGYTNYFEPNVKEEDILDIVHKCLIGVSHRRLKHHIASGNNIDPTSVWNAVM